MPPRKAKKAADGADAPPPAAKKGLGKATAASVEAEAVEAPAAQEENAKKGLGKATAASVEAEAVEDPAAQEEKSTPTNKKRGKSGSLDEPQGPAAAPAAKRGKVSSPPEVQVAAVPPPPPPLPVLVHAPPPPPPTSVANSVHPPPPPPPPVHQAPLAVSAPPPPPPMVQHAAPLAAARPPPPPAPTSATNAPAAPSSSTSASTSSTSSSTSSSMVISLPPSSSTALVSAAKTKASSVQGRTSELSAPNMCLSGHEGAIYCASFEPTAGNALATAGLDAKVFLWNVFGECKNYNVLAGHKNAILEMHWLSSGTHLVTCSADHTAAMWDAAKGCRVKKYVEHTGIVNCCGVGKSNPHMFATGSDDCTAILWDTRSKTSVATMYHNYQVTSLCLSADGATVYTGGIDNIVRSWDVRHGDPKKESLSLVGHADTVTGLALSPDESLLLSNAADSTLRTWDVRPFAANNARCMQIFTGLHHGAEKLLLRCAWSPDQSKISCGSADRCVHIWDVDRGAPLYILPGHKASVNEAIFHPLQPVICSVSSDRTIFLGEIQ